MDGRVKIVYRSAELRSRAQEWNASALIRILSVHAHIHDRHLDCEDDTFIAHGHRTAGVA